MTEQLGLHTPSSRAPDHAEPIRELIERIAKDLARSERRTGLVALTWPVPRVPSERLLAASHDGDAMLWAPPGEDEASGLGSVSTLTAQGSNRFESIRQQAAAFWPELDASGCDRAAPEPCFFGGFAFQAGQAPSEVWDGFGDARFVLPRISYLRNRAGAWLRLIVVGRVWDRASFRAELEGPLTLALQALFSPLGGRSAVRELARQEGTTETWSELVRAIQDEIASGQVQKIVAARRLELRLDRELLPELVQARLREDAPESTRFAIRVDGKTFLGATPEQLIRKTGLELCTEAVAGSISADDEQSAERLLASGKDIREHEFVVSEILSLLAPLTKTLAPARERQIHRLRTVLHLRTPITGILSSPRHVLELVERLHPTPAVGGVPTGAAIAFIVRHEPDPRGWYSGPVGWFDAAGDGRFVVALRSGVVSGTEATLYAGAGVVKDSNAPSELAETRWKFAALLGALGVSG